MMKMGEMLIITFVSLFGNFLCSPMDSNTPDESHVTADSVYLSRGSRQYPYHYGYYPYYARDEIVKPRADDMLLIEGGVYWPHDPEDPYSSRGSHTNYGNNYGVYRPYDVGGYYSNWQGSASATSEEKDYNYEADRTQPERNLKEVLRSRRSLLKDSISEVHHYFPA